MNHVFLLVERGAAEYGVVPLENSTEGGVTPTLDSFVQYLDTAIQICGEVVLPIGHHLISNAPREDIRVVYSHPAGACAMPRLAGRGVASCGNGGNGEYCCSRSQNQGRGGGGGDCKRACSAS